MNESEKTNILNCILYQDIINIKENGAFTQTIIVCGFIWQNDMNTLRNGAL